MKAVIRALIGAAVAVVLLAPAAQAQPLTPTCDPAPFPDVVGGCPSPYCEIDGVTYAAGCDKVVRPGPGLWAITGVLALIGVFWVLPAVVIYRAAKHRGLPASEITWSWVLFGWVGLSYQLFKAIPRADQTPPPGMDQGPYDTTRFMERAALRLATTKQQRKAP